MNLSLSPDVQERINARVDAGHYPSAEDVITAAIFALEKQEQLGNFQPGEWDALLAEGERSIEEEGTLDGEEAYQLRRQRLAEMRKNMP